MAKVVVKFFTRTNWSIVDLLWVIILTGFFAWALYPVYSDWLFPQTQQKYITNTPHE